MSRPRLTCFSLDGGELFSRIQDRGDQAFTERGRKGLLRARLGGGAAGLQGPALGRRSGPPPRLLLGSARSCASPSGAGGGIFPGGPWCRPFKPKDTSCDLALPPRPLLPRRGLRDHEEHRRGHPVFALDQHCPSGCQGASYLRRGPRPSPTRWAWSPWAQGPRVVLRSRGLAPGGSAPQAVPSLGKPPPGREAF